MAFSDNIQQLRKKSNLSQEKLAEQLNITRQAVSKWESAQSVPDADICLKLCEIFKVSPNQLFWGEDGNCSLKYVANDKQTKISDYAVFSMFMTAILICGTVLLICNLYNGHTFEPIIHSMSFMIIQGSVIVFGVVSVYNFINKTNKKKK